MSKVNTTEKLTPNDVIKEYLDLRDNQLKKLDVEYKEDRREIEERMQYLNHRITRGFNHQLANKDNPTTSISTKYGRAHREVKVRMRVTDAQKVRQWVLEDPAGRVGYLVAALAKNDVLEYLEQEGLFQKPKNNQPIKEFDAEPIPGIEITLLTETKFTKPTNRG